MFNWLGKKAKSVSIEIENGPVKPNKEGRYFPTQRKFGSHCGSVITVSFGFRGEVNYAFSDHSRCLAPCGDCYRKVEEIKKVFASCITSRTGLDNYEKMFADLVKKSTRVK